MLPLLVILALPIAVIGAMFMSVEVLLSYLVLEIVAIVT